MNASRKQSFQDKGVTKLELGHERRRGSGRGRRKWWARSPFAATAGNFRRMSTLAEIESAAAALSPREKTELLLLFVAGQLRAEGAPLPEPRLFSPEQLAAWMDEDEVDMLKCRAEMSGANLTAAV